MEKITSVKITKIDGDRVWFTVEHEEYRIDGELHPCESDYCTSKDGEGLFLGDNFAHQIAGTCQFSLRHVSRSTMHRRIRSYFQAVR